MRVAHPPRTVHVQLCGALLAGGHRYPQHTDRGGAVLAVLAHSHQLRAHGHGPLRHNNNNNNNNNNNIYLLQLGCYPVAVVILHVNKHEIGYY